MFYLSAWSLGFIAPFISLSFLLVQPQEEREYVGCLTAYYLIVPAHLTYHMNARTSITGTEPLLHTPLVPPSWVRNAVCALRKCRWAFGNRGGQEEMGWNVPAATSSPRLNTSYIFNAHIPSCYLPHINNLYSVCVWVCVVVMLGCRNMGSVPSGQRKKMTYLTQRESTWH